MYYIGNKKIDEIVEKAKNGNKLAYNELYRHYKNIFVNNVEKNYGSSYKSLAKEDYKEVFNSYFLKERKTSLYVYILYRSKYIYNNRSITKEEALEVYPSSYFYKIKNNSNIKSNVLSDKELFNLCDNIVTHMINSYFKSEKKSTLPIYIHSRMDYIIKKFYDEEKILLYYLKYHISTKKIEDYFINKYSYLIEECNFTDYELYCFIIKKILVRKDLLKRKLSKLVKEELLKDKIKANEEKQANLKKARELLLSLSSDNYDSKDLDFIRFSYSYIATEIYNELELSSNIPKEKLFSMITCEYDRIFSVYINGIIKGKIKSSLPKYIRTSLKNNIKTIEKHYINYEDDKIKEGNVKTS